jgi:hypothetical protein
VDSWLASGITPSGTIRGCVFVALMIPDRLPSGSSKGEQRLFAILQKLPDDYIVYYEPVISDRYPDFLVIAPTWASSSSK